MDIPSLITHFQNQLQDIEDLEQDIIRQSQQVIVLCREVLSGLKIVVQKHNFDSTEEEIEFFKSTKQIPLKQLVYYSEVYHFELRYPKSNSKIQRKYIQRKLDSADQLFLENIDFVQYIQTGLTYFDKYYFTRNNFELELSPSSKQYYQDANFNTPRDNLLARVEGHQLLVRYLKEKLVNIKSPRSNEIVGKLRWTSTKTALTELIYALYYNRCINNGEVDIKQVAKTFSQLFNFNLTDVYKIYSEIKNRKSSRSKFLDELAYELNKEIEKGDL